MRAGGVASRVDSVRDRGDRVRVGCPVQGEPDPLVFAAVELGPAGAKVRFRGQGAGGEAGDDVWVVAESCVAGRLRGGPPGQVPQRRFG